MEEDVRPALPAVTAPIRRGDAMRRRVSIVLLCVFIPIAMHAACDYVASRRLYATVDDLRQRGEPVSRNALGRWQPPASAEETQAARLYSAAAALAYHDWTVAHEAPGGIKQQPLSRVRDDLESVAKERALAPETAASLQALVDTFGDAFAMMDRAAGLVFSRFIPHDFEDYPRTYSLEELAEASAARTIVLASGGNGDDAARSLWSTLKLRRAHVRTAPWLSEELVALQFLLEHARPSLQLLQQVQDGYAERQAPDATARGLRELRAVGIDALFAEWYGRQTDPLTPAAYARWAWRPSLPLRPWVARQATHALKISQHAVNAAQLPWPARIEALRQLAALQPDPGSRRGRPGIHDYGRYIIRGVGEEGVIRDAMRLTQIRSALAAVAVERFRRDRSGVFPNTLEETVPTYMPAVPEDPFTGRPLRYLVDATRFVVYSPGPDGTDDRGLVGPLPLHVWKVTTADIGLEIRTFSPEEERK